MGCCTRFHKTWWPGYTAEAINPNKVFDCQRRLDRFKKALIALFFIALVVGLIYFLITFTSSGGVGGGEGSRNFTNSSTVVANSAALLGSSGGNVKNSTPSVNITKVKEEQEGKVNQTLIDSGIDALHSQNQSESTLNSTEAEVVPPQIKQFNELHANDTRNDTIPPSGGKEPRAWCVNKQNAVDCVGLTKSFATVATFSNKSKSHKKHAEGYIMIMENGAWHPYCYKDQWSLEMAYELCRSLGFKDLVKLTTVTIAELEGRVHLGKGISLQSTKRSVAPPAPNIAYPKPNFNCNVGHISCK